MAARGSAGTHWEVSSRLIRGLFPGDRTALMFLPGATTTHSGVPDGPGAHGLPGTLSEAINLRRTSVAFARAGQGQRGFSIEESAAIEVFKTDLYFYAVLEEVSDVLLATLLPI